MSLVFSNNVLNLADLQQKMEEIVFDYIDSKPNWEKAYMLLDEMLEQTTRYFVDQVQDKGELPQPSVYWTLFTELNAKLIYFTTLALKNREKKSSGITNEVLANRFETAAECLVNIHTEENEEFVKEIQATFEEVSDRTDFKGGQDRDTVQCIKAFYEFAKNY